MRGGIKLGRIFGIKIQLHYSWWFIAIFIAWSLSTTFFPHYFPGQMTMLYWFMGVVASVLLFVSVLFHELSHSLVAKARNIKVESITLFFFGGVAGITDEDMKPSSEFFMAIAGPLFSLALSGIFFILYKIDGNFIVTAISFYLFQLNLILAIFNFVPGYPLDGGRAFRAILYSYYKDLKKATKIAVAVGRFFAGFLIVMGLYSMFAGIPTGLWLILIGGFLYFVAGVSYQQVVFKEALVKISVKTLLKKKIPTVKPDMKFSEFVKKFIAKETNYFLVKGGKYLGLLDSKRVQGMPKKMQQMVKVKQLAIPMSAIQGVQIDDKAYAAHKKFASHELDILPVFKGTKMVGFITKQAVMHHLVWGLKFSQ